MLVQEGWRVIAYSRQSPGRAIPGVEWRHIDPSASTGLPVDETGVYCWFCLAPIWALTEYFSLLEGHKAKRVVALSSTSRFTKTGSSYPAEQAVAQRLAHGEARFREWAEASGVDWTILRPTLIYGRGRDKNIAEIARFIRRFGFFPLLGKGTGLRQPIHADDVAGACLSAMKSPAAVKQAYNISGGETLCYREMVHRVFLAVHRRTRMVSIPLTVLRLALICLHLLPRYRHWSIAMAERMNRDLVFEHSEATRDFGFSPRSFQPTPKDAVR
jgi:nucleoside-diphosphate-sugar epimerase